MNRHNQSLKFLGPRILYAMAIASVGLLMFGGEKPVLGETRFTEEQLQLPPGTVETSPTLQRWIPETPDLPQEIRRDPAFLPRIRLGYVYDFTSPTGQGVGIAVEDWRLGGCPTPTTCSPLGISGDYSTTFNGQQSGGLQLHYDLLPLGYALNISPIVGYRSIHQNSFETDGLMVGARAILSLSRTGAADLRISQGFTNPGGSEEVGTFTAAVSYALTPHWRISTEFQQQNTPGGDRQRVGLWWEWQPKP